MGSVTCTLAGYTLDKMHAAYRQPYVVIRRIYGYPLAANRYDIPPLLRLPNELLSTVLELATFAHDDRVERADAPLPLSQICRRLRQVAFSTGSLWTNIIITYPFTLGQYYTTFSHLSRSKSAPLDIYLDIREVGWDFNESSHDSTTEELDPYLLMLLPHVGRWRNFTMLSDAWEPLFNVLLYSTKLPAASNLETLTLSRNNAYFARKGETFLPESMKKPIPLFGGQCLPKLRHVTLVGVHVDWDVSQLRNLTSLSFKLHAGDVMPSLKTFKDILTGCKELSSLTILGWGPPDVAQNEHDRKTRSIELSILLPSLTSFTLGLVDGQHAMDLLSIFFFPNLQHLSIEDLSPILHPNDSVDASSIFEHIIQGQEKHTLCQCPASTSSTRHSSPAPFPLSSLHSFFLQSVSCSDATLNRLLTHMIALKTLHLTQLDASLLQGALCSSPSGSLHNNGSNDSISGVHNISDGPILPCPNLQSISCRSIDITTLADVAVKRQQYSRNKGRLPALKEISWIDPDPEESSALFDDVASELAENGTELIIVEHEASD